MDNVNNKLVNNVKIGVPKNDASIDADNITDLNTETDKGYSPHNVLMRSNQEKIHFLCIKRTR